MGVVLSKEGASLAADALAAYTKVQTLDGRHLAVTLRPDGDDVLAEVTPDTSRVTMVRLRLGGSGDSVVTLSLQRLVDMCRRAEGGLTLEASGGVVLAGIWQTPELPEHPTPTGFTAQAEVDANAFSGALSAVRYAASTDPVRPRLCLVHFGNGFARACDGLRYHEQRTGFTLDWDVPGHCAGAVEKLTTRYGGTLRLSASATHQMYETWGMTLVVPMPGQGYLDLDEVVAAPVRAHNHHLLRVRREALHRAVRDVSIMAGESRAVNLEVTAGQLVVTASDGLNTGRVELPCEWADDPRSLRFWVAPLLQLLNTSSRDLVEFRLGTSTLKSPTPIALWEDDNFAMLNQIRGG